MIALEHNNSLHYPTTSILRYTSWNRYWQPVFLHPREDLPRVHRLRRCRSPHKCSHLHTEIFLSSRTPKPETHPLTTRQSEIIKIFFSHLAPAGSCYKVLNEYIILSIPFETKNTQKKQTLSPPQVRSIWPPPVEDLCTVEDDTTDKHTLSKIIFSPFVWMPCRFVRFWWDLIESCINLI